MKFKTELKGDIRKERIGPLNESEWPKLRSLLNLAQEDVNHPHWSPMFNIATSLFYSLKWAGWAPSQESPTISFEEFNDKYFDNAKNG